MSKEKTNVSPEEYRGELIKAGYTVSSWARAHGHHPSTVFESIRGNRRGPLSRKILEQLNRELFEG